MAQAKASQSDGKSFFEEQAKMGAQMQAQWAELLQQWQGASKVPGAETYKNFFADAGRQYLDMLQMFQGGASRGQESPDVLKEWIAGLQRVFTGATASPHQQGFAQFGESMMKAGNAFASSFQNGGPFAQNPKGMGAFDPFGFFASMPGIGYTREKQEAWGELYERWTTFEKSTNKYNEAMAKVGMEAAQKFQSYVFNPPKDAPPLSSLKSIYVKWVDICEEIYARFAMSQEYTELYGETVNALMAWRKKLNSLTDQMVGDLNLPTRKEVDSLHERVHALRRDNIQLKKDVEDLKRAVFKEKPAPKVTKKIMKKGKR